MPSTYTVNLGIEKPATGEQSGTWGDTTNVNFDIIDQAINGVLSLTLASAGTSGSPNALTIDNGATSDGRNKWIEFVDGGDLGANAYVQLGPNDAEKIVFFRNSLSGSRSVFVFQGTYNAANDFEIPAGYDVVLKFDGGGASATVTDVFQKLRVTELYTPTLGAGTADINDGTVEAVIGGATPKAGTFTTLTANTNLTVNASTTVDGIIDDDTMATASATKLSTSESIKAYVDSQVGTVDTLSEILANGNTSGANNLIINNGQAITTNTVNETTAGSGVTVDGVLLKDDGINATNLEITNIKANDGTAAGSIANSTGAVTITSFISNSVDIGGGAIDGTTIGGTTPNSGAFTTFTSTGIDDNASSTALTISSADNVGIGTATPDRLFEVEEASGDAYIRLRASDTGGGADTIFENLCADNAQNNYIYFGDLDDVNIGIIRYSHASDFMSFTTNASERMRIDSSGNVGIGVTSPTFKLDVRGTTASVANFYQLTAATNTDIYVNNVGSANNFLISRRSNGESWLYNSGADPFVFSTNASERMRIDSSGNVGIGTTSPIDKLNVSDGTATFQLKPIGGSSIGYFGMRTNHALGLTTNDTERMRIDSSGNVGIGTSSPSTYGKLAVWGGKAGTSTSSAAFSTPGSAQGEDADLALYSTFENTGDDFPRRTADIIAGFNGSSWGTEYLSFNVGNNGSDNDSRVVTSEKMRIDSSGNVGIGTSDPRSGLHIYGLGQSTANITDAGDQGAFLRVSDSTSNTGSGGGVIFGNVQSDDTGAVGFAAIKGYLIDGNDNTTGDLTFSTRSGTTATALTERMRIDSIGNVGIGKTPSSGIKLDVEGKVNVNERLTIDHTAAANIYIGDGASSSTSNRYLAFYHDNGLRIQTRTDAGVFVSNDYFIDTNASGATAHRWSIANSEKMRIDSSGNVGIGTSSPTYRLQTAGPSPGIAIQNTGSGGGWVDFLDSGGTVRGNIYYDNTSGYMVFGTSPSGTFSERMRIDSSGNVGIGTLSPTEKLQISGAANSTLLLGYSDGDGVGYRLRSNVTTTVDGGFNIEYNDGTDLYRVDHDGGSGFHAWYMGGTERMRIDSSGVVRPGADNTQTLGSASYRWSVVYAGTGTINTSDEREKQQIADLDDAERRVAVALKGLVKKFKYNDAVALKGDDARIHVGVIAQEVIAAFAAEGLDATRYALLCHDTWEAEPEETDDEGNVINPGIEAGERYGIRYDELLAFMIAAL